MSDAYVTRGDYQPFTGAGTVTAAALTLPVDILADARLFKGAPYAPGSLATLPLTGSITTSGASDNPVSLVCATTSDASFVQFAKLTAIAVTTLHVQ